jgi:DNA-3-methyladenine glycosylase II
MRAILEATGLPPLRRSAPDFRGLALIVVSQQVSTASAEAIARRLEAELGAVTAQTVLAASEEALRRAGLSGPKIRALRAAAGAGVDLAGLGALPPEEAHATLTAIPGIGPWTADLYLMVCVGHADVFAPGDLALQESARLALGLEARPSARELDRLALRWSPWRAVAARLLWAYYRLLKARPGAPSAG